MPLRGPCHATSPAAGTRKRRSAPRYPNRVDGPLGGVGTPLTHRSLDRVPLRVSGAAAHGSERPSWLRLVDERNHAVRHPPAMERKWTERTHARRAQPEGSSDSIQIRSLAY